MLGGAGMKKMATFEKIAQVRRLKEKDMGTIGPEVKRVIREDEDGTGVVEILQGTAVNISEGFLGQHGVWLEGARRVGGEIHTLLGRNLETLPVKQMCKAVSSVMHSLDSASPGAGSPASERVVGIQALVLQKTLVDEEDAAVLGAVIGSREDGPADEGYHCTLRSVIMSNNMLRDRGAKAVVSKLAQNRLLERLELLDNNISDEGAAAVMRACVGHTLAEFSLADNRIGDPGARWVAPMLEGCKFLTALHLSGNMIGDLGATSIAQGLTLNKTIRTLNLNANRVSNPGVEALACALRVLPDAYVMGFEGTLGPIPPECMGKVYRNYNTSLTALHLASNFLSDPAALSIASVFGASKTLVSVELSNNRIGDPGAKALADALKALVTDAAERGEAPIGRMLSLSCNALGSTTIAMLDKTLLGTGNVHSVSIGGVRCSMRHRVAFQRGIAHLPRLPPPGAPANTPALSKLRLEEIVKPAERKPKTAERLGLRPHALEGKASGSLTARASWGLTLKRGSPDGISGSQTARTGGRGEGGGLLVALARGKERAMQEEDWAAERARRRELDLDPSFLSACERLMVPNDVDPRKGREADFDKAQRARRDAVYDTFVSVQTRHPRPQLGAAVRVQSMFRMRRAQNQAFLLRLAAKRTRIAQEASVAGNLGMSQAELQTSVAALQGNLAVNRSWRYWRQYIVRARTLRTDIREQFVHSCNIMGVKAAGASNLGTFMRLPYTTLLDLAGVGMTPSGARALSLIVRGYDTCNLCHGNGTIANDIFATGGDPTGDGLNHQQVFDFLDTDGEGSIDMSELSSAFLFLGLSLSTEEIAALFAQMDKDKSGSVDKDEFQQLFKRLSQNKHRGKCFLCGGKGHTAKRAYMEGEGGTQREFCSLLEVRQELNYGAIAHLNISDNCLKARGVCDLVDLILDCKLDLESLKLAHNEMGDDGARDIARLLRHAEVRLKVLDLTSNSINDYGIQTISKAVGQSTSLLTLALSHNSCGVHGAAALGQMLEHNGTLIDLELCWAGISGMGAVHFCQGLSQSVSLRSLNLQWNGFNDMMACEAVASAMREVRALETLNLSRNRIGLKGAQALADGLIDNIGMHQLVMSGNPLTVSGAKALIRAASERADAGNHARAVVLEDCQVGIIDMSTFDPSQPAGRYSLDMENASSKTVMRDVLGLMLEGHVIIEDQKLDLLTLEQVMDPVTLEPLLDPETKVPVTESKANPYRLEAFNSREEFEEKAGLVSKDQSTWALPGQGTLEFTLVAPKSRGGMQHQMLFPPAPSKIVKHIRTQLLWSDKILTPGGKADLVVTLLSREQAGSARGVLHGALQDILGLVMRGQTRAERVTAGANVVASLIMTVAGVDSPWQVLKLLPPDGRIEALELLGWEQLPFVPSNPTGHYRLDLADPNQRDVAHRLVEAKAAQNQFEDRCRDFLVGRVGGAREVQQRCWRNATLDDQPFAYHKDWKAPTDGILTLDFVQVRFSCFAVRGRNEDKVLEETELQDLIEALRAMQNSPLDQVLAVRQASGSRTFFTSQVAEMLEAVPPSGETFIQPRIEIFIACYARTVDHAGLVYLLHHLLPFEEAQVRRRIGAENLLDEFMAANHYSLDLGNQSERFVVQELLQLSLETPSVGRMLEIFYEGCVFELPASWTISVPQRGVVSFFFVFNEQEREKQRIWESMGRSSVTIPLKFRSNSPARVNSAARRGLEASQSTKANFRGISIENGDPNQEFCFTEFVPQWIEPHVVKGEQVSLGEAWLSDFRLRRTRALIIQRALVLEVPPEDVVTFPEEQQLPRATFLALLTKAGIWLSFSDELLLVSLLQKLPMPAHAPSPDPSVASAPKAAVRSVRGDSPFTSPPASAASSFRKSSMDHGGLSPINRPDDATPLPPGEEVRQIFTATGTPISGMDGLRRRGVKVARRKARTAPMPLSPVLVASGHVTLEQFREFLSEYSFA